MDSTGAIYLLLDESIFARFIQVYVLTSYGNKPCGQFEFYGCAASEPELMCKQKHNVEVPQHTM